MQSISLLPISPRGVELGLLPLPGWQSAGAGEAGSHCPELDREAADLEEAIREVLEAEGMQALSEDPMDFSVLVSRALLSDSPGPALVIRMPVRESQVRRPAFAPAGAGNQSRPANGSLEALLSGLFELDDISDEGDEFTGTEEFFEDEEGDDYDG